MAPVLGKYGFSFAINSYRRNRRGCSIHVIISQLMWNTLWPDNIKGIGVANFIVGAHFPSNGLGPERFGPERINELLNIGHAGPSLQ